MFIMSKKENIIHFFMTKEILFLLISVPVIFFSFRSIIRPYTHGFARFFGWEIMIWIFLSVRPFWFDKPFTIIQVLSWFLLVVSAFFVVSGALNLLIRGKPSSQRDEKHLFNFEKTTELVETGIFKYIRHPLYASLIYLSWGMTLKNPTTILICFTLAATILFYITAKKDEKECIEYFGEKYADYMKHTKMLIPFVF